MTYLILNRFIFLRGSISLENAPPGMLPRLQQMMTSSRMGESMSSTTIQRRVLGNISKAELKPKAPQKNISKQKKILGARPLYRTDVLYQGSLMRLDTYTEKVSIYSILNSFFFI